MMGIVSIDTMPMGSCGDGLSFGGWLGERGVWGGLRRHLRSALSLWQTSTVVKNLEELELF